MTISTEIFVCLLTAVGTGISGFLSIVIHLLLKINGSIVSLEKRAEVDAERYQNVGIRLQGIETRLNTGKEILQ